VIRSFVTEELKRTFLPGIGAAAGLTVLSFLLIPLFRRLSDNPSDAENSANAVVVFLIVLLTSVWGSAAFSLPFRQGPLRLIENLPVLRYRVWLIRLQTCMLTAAASAGLLAVAHPSVVVNNREDMVLALATGFLIFIGGLCWGMLIQAGTVAVTILNLALTLPLVVMLAIYSTFVTGGFIVSDADFAFGAALICATYLAVSFRMFMRGEFEVKRRRVLNGALLGGTLMIVFMATILAADMGMLAYGENWTIFRWRPSPDRRYLGLVLNRESHSPVTKAVILDVESGAVVKSFSQPSLWDLLWTRDGSLVALSHGTILERFLGIGEKKARLTRLLPEEEALFVKRGSWERAFRAGDWGTYAAITSVFLFQRWAGTTSLIRIDTPEGPTEVLSTPWRRGDWVPGAIAVRGGYEFRTYGYAEARWIIGEKIRKVAFTWGPFPLPDEASLVAMREEFFKSAPELQDPSVTRGVYIRSDSNTSFAEDGWLYFLEANTVSRVGRLLARRKSEQKWKPVLEAFPLSDAEIKLMARTDRYALASDYRLWTGFHDGIVVRVYRAAGKPRILLVNLVTGENLDIEDSNSTAYRPTDGQWIEVVSRLEEMSIRPQRYINRTPVVVPITYSYRPGSGSLTPVIPTPADRTVRSPAFHGPNGTEVYFDSSAGVFTTRSPGGAERRLWPQ
jgi:hypothetical protein